MATLTSLCVYCGSSERVAERHKEAAADLGRAAAQRGVRIVFGGGRVGLMGVLAEAALQAGGKVTGIIPEQLRAREVGHDGIGDLRVVGTMHARKQLMCEDSDAFCALPGGLGTLDETFEIVTWKQLGIHDKPVVLVNVAGYWDPLLALVEHQAEAGYVRPAHRELFQVVQTVDQIFETVAAAPEPRIKGLSWMG
ncbi:MAG: TIGR00730 family Rossman fold protein [Rhodospirillales bacterium]|nr:TIGR00730 family Rossman fold protein [Rhodospirillales bacterium]